MRFFGALRSRNFWWLWTGHTISLAGSFITSTTLAFLATLNLHASAAQMALLALCQFVPGALVGLFAGVVADRFPKRRLLIVCDVLRALVVATVPLLAARGYLSFGLIATVIVLHATFSTFFEVAHGAYLPTLIPESDLEIANSRLSVAGSAAQIFGFGAAGWLTQALGADALWVDVASFVLSALALWQIRTDALVTPPPSGEHGEAEIPFWHVRALTVGMREVMQQRVLAILALLQLGLGLEMGVFGALYTLHVTKTLGFAPGELGLIYAVGGVTSLFGALFTTWLQRCLGTRRALFVGYALIGLGSLPIALAPARTLSGKMMLVLNQCVTDPAWAVFDILATSARQRCTPVGAQGRVGGVFQMLSLTGSLLGTILAGATGDRFGTRLPMTIAAVVVMLCALLLLRISSSSLNDNQ
jgi:MFS family permease